MSITKQELLSEMRDFQNNSGFAGGIPKLEELLSNYKKGSHTTTPGLPSFFIKSTTETAYQRAIFSDTYSDLVLSTGDELHVEWLDLEVPLTFSKKARRPSADLIGECGNSYAIGELKYCKNTSSMRPEYAIFEVLMYNWFIDDNVTDLHKHDVSHEGKNIHWDNFFAESQYLIVGANKRYWDYWLKTRGNEKFSYRKITSENEQGVDGKLSNSQNISNLISYLNNKYSVKIMCFETPDCDFEKQRGDSDKYEPKLIKEFRWEQLFVNDD